MTVLLNLERRALAAPTRRRVQRGWRVGATVLLSVGLHVALIGGLVYWMQRPALVALEPADTQATVELVMSPPGGEPATAAAPSPEQPPAPETPQETAAAPEAPPTATPTTAATTAQAPPATTPTTEDAPPVEDAPPPPAPPAPKAADNKMIFDFAQAESDTNAWVTGDSVVPASLDVKFHNRKPSYPNDAAYRGEQGAVILLVHVSPDGLVSGVDVLRSSGFNALDRAARDAVLTWHFLPSMKDGRPVPEDLPMRFVFALD